MNEAAAIQQLPRVRSQEAVSADLWAEMRHRDYLMKLAGEFAALDMRPMIWDGERVTYTRDLAIPEDLKNHMRESAERIARLEMELREAYDRWIATRYGFFGR